MKAADHGLFFIRDLLGMGRKTLIGVWPDLFAADDAEVAIRLKLAELAAQIGRAGETTENTVVYEL